MNFATTMAIFPELILFDAAGTLIEPAEPVETTYQRYFADFGWETDASRIGASFRKIFTDLPEPVFTDSSDGDLAEKEWWREVVVRTAVAAGIDTGLEKFERCFEKIFTHYANGDAWIAFPETEEVLSRLKSTGSKLAVVSNFDRRLHQVLEQLGLTGWFDLILTSADVGGRKPSPAILNAALDHFSVRPENSCLVGDSNAADAAAARASGVPVFILDRPQTGLIDFEKWINENFC